MNQNAQLISMWLGGKRDFEAGVAIHERLGTNYVLKLMLRKGHTSFREEQLVKAMNELLIEIGQEHEPAATPAEIIEEAAHFVASVENHGIKASDLPNAPIEVQEAIKKRRNLYGEYQRLFATLKEYTPPEIREANSLRILDIFDEIHPLWVLTNYYNQHQRLPDAPKQKTIEDLSIVEANQLYDANYKYVRKCWGDDKKKDNILMRLEQNTQLKTRLENENAFIHHRLVMPAFTD